MQVLFEGANITLLPPSTVVHFLPLFFHQRLSIALLRCNFFKCSPFFISMVNLLFVNMTF